jgi:hypothetical protein
VRDKLVGVADGVGTPFSRIQPGHVTSHEGAGAGRGGAGVNANGQHIHKRYRAGAGVSGADRPQGDRVIRDVAGGS